MKKAAILLLTLTLFFSCKKESQTTDYTNETLDVTTSIYPDDISRIFDAHGGIDTWNQFESMYFEIEKPAVNDEYTVALKSRKSLVAYQHHLLGYNGADVWVKDLDTTTYKSNPKFYYNLMFYFYAMPFVLGDDGINYAEGPSLEMDGKEYPGILISYNDGVGTSSDDEYVLYYDPETYKMTWLAYTVTFFSKEKTKDFHLIKYADWITVNGLELPTTLQWHHFEDGEVGAMRNEMKFIKAKLSKEVPDDTMFNIPEGATIAE